MVEKYFKLFFANKCTISFSENFDDGEVVILKIDEPKSKRRRRNFVRLKDEVFKFALQAKNGHQRH